jgi:hypothetical protein
MTKWHLCNPRLVVCGDMLLMVGYRKDFHVIGSIFETYRLDPSTELAKWVKLERLEKWAIFISNDSRVTVDEPREVGREEQPCILL